MYMYLLQFVTTISMYLIFKEVFKSLFSFFMISIHRLRVFLAKKLKPLKQSAICIAEDMCRKKINHNSSSGPGPFVQSTTQGCQNHT